jgi:hypothetical protein
MEDALTNNFNQLKSMKKSPLDSLFPFKNSTIGEIEISAILKKCDLDKNELITRREMAQLFLANKDWVTTPFTHRIE